MVQLNQIDTLDIRVLVNDQLDNIAPSRHDEVVALGRFSHVPLRKLNDTERQGRSNAKLELYLPNSCCGAHGLSLIITAATASQTHTMLFDAGPEGDIWAKNVKRLGLEKDVGNIESIHLSHWHRDHSGGLERAINLINTNRASQKGPVKLDLHPNRPNYRGFATPHGPISLEADPTIPQLEAAGADIELNGEQHTILDGMFFVSGEIPRLTDYETGIDNGIRLDSEERGWEADTQIQDERFVMCHLKGKGLVVFTGCSHAGVINVLRHAIDIGDKVPIFAVIGGFHLSDAHEDKLAHTIRDLKSLEPTVLMPGHCSGWKVQAEAEKVLPGRTVPIYCGQKYGMKGVQA